MKSPPQKTFLIVRTDRLGDVALTIPMARAIKHAMPEARVAFLARSYTEPIIARAPDVDEVLIAENDISFHDLIRRFRSSHADIAFFPSPRFRLALAAFFARIPVRVGTGYRWYSFLFNRRIREHRKTAERHEAEYNLRMLAHVGSSADENLLASLQLREPERELVRAWLAAHLRDPAAKFAIFHPTLGGSSHPWPLDKFAELGRKIVNRYGMAIILTGERQDQSNLEIVANGIGSRAIVFSDHTLPELAVLLERADLVIAASTGPGHLAAVLGTRTIGLFPLPKPLSKERWGFRGPRAMNLSPEALPECPNCKACTCMERLDVQTVWKEVEAALGDPAPVSY